jgi:hypothetical protein
MQKHHIQRLAEEQVLFLLQHQQMSPNDIIASYTGEMPSYACFDDAVRVVADFNFHVAA